MTKICPTCGDPFVAMLDSKVFCSPKCRAHRHKATIEPIEAPKKPDKPETVYKVKECATCFEPFTPDHHAVRHCPMCKDAALKAKQAKRLEQERTPVNSRMSSTEFGHLPNKRNMPACTIEHALEVSPSTATEFRVVIGKTVYYPRCEKRYRMLLRKQNGEAVDLNPNKPVGMNNNKPKEYEDAFPIE